MPFDFKSTLKNFRDFFEGTPLIVILIITSILGLSWLADLIGLINYVTEADKNIVYLGIFLFYLISLVVNIYIIIRLRNLRKSYVDLENQKAAISDILLQAATLNSPSYSLKKWHERFEILENGDTKYTRRVIIEYINSPVQWFEYKMRLIEGHKISTIEDLNIQVYTIKNGRRDKDLSWAVPLTARERLKSVVLLHPPVVKGSPLELELRFIWRGLFTPLIANNTDKCAISLSRPTEDIQIQFISPPDYRFTKFKITNDVGNYRTRKKRDGRSTLTFKANKIPEQQYFYWISWEKIVG